MISSRILPAVVVPIVLSGSFFLAAPAVRAESPVVTVQSRPDPIDLNVEVPGLADAVGKTARLVEQGDGGVSFPAQIAPAAAEDGTVANDKAAVLAIIPGSQVDLPKRTFQVEIVETPDAPAPAFRWESLGENRLKLWEGDQPVLVYNFDTVTEPSVPESDSRRSRACYIHPVWGLNGEQLTDDFPRDHYHHHGVFWSWPHVEIDGKHYDLWMYSNIRHRFGRWIVQQAGPQAAVLAVENGWFVEDRQVVVERVWIWIFRRNDGGRAIDIRLVCTPIDRPVKLWGAEGKSYGGLTVRFRPGKREDSVITTPSGPAAGDLPDTPLAWADYTSKFDGRESQSGAAVMVSPRHPNYPPTWLTRYYGPLCVGWPGLQPITFEPGTPFAMGYRLWMHPTALEPPALQGAYDAYRASVEAELSPSGK